MRKIHFTKPALLAIKAMNRQHKNLLSLFLFAFTMFSLCFIGPLSLKAQTANGELENRPAPVAKRKCTGGSGSLCNENSDCPGSACVDRNVFNISVAVQFNATAAQLTTIQNLITAGSATLFDATDGQAEIGLAFIYNNAFGTGGDADVRIYPASSPTWWLANTGNWQNGGSIHVSIDNVNAATNPGESFAHEFIHLVFDARDEYESRASGCGAVNGSASCPASGSGANACLMDQGGIGNGTGTADHSELCWGQGTSSNLMDFTNGNHDPTNVTEHSVCRSNRSCWDQIVWSWPNTFLEPTGAPNAAANGLTVHPTNFLLPSNTARVVLVLDESGSMDLETPKRMERLKVAANDFITLAESGTELGIVSYSDDAETSSGRQNVAIASLGATRTTWTNAINALTPNNYTNIGAGLQKAMDMITTAGGVTANTFIVLMTDGINNRPSPQSTADADLQSKIDALLDAGIPVYVTCTGSDLGLNSQCAEIATGSGGFYVDSSDPSTLPEAFVDMYERCARRDAIASYSNWKDESGSNFYVETGSESAHFTLQWNDINAKGTMVMIDPNGTTYKSEGMPQGRYVAVKNPIVGEWKMQIDFIGSTPSHFVKRGYSRNPVHSLVAHARYPSVKPGEEIKLFAFPLSNGGSVTDVTRVLKCTVVRPDGTMDHMELDDKGTGSPGSDDDEGDGTYTGIYKHTDLKGSYQFLIRAEVDGWVPSEVAHRQDKESKSAKFVREVRLSAAVGDPNDQVKEPEDDKKPPKDQPGGVRDWWKWILALILLLLLVTWLRRRRRK